MNGEKGFVLPGVLAAMAVGILLVSPFLSQASTSLMCNTDYGQSFKQQHSADAGIEHAIWDLTYDDLALQFSSPGDNYNYQLGESVNGIAPDITVTAITLNPGSSSYTYDIVSTANDNTIISRVTIAGTVSVHSWEIE